MENLLGIGIFLIVMILNCIMYYKLGKWEGEWKGKRDVLEKLKKLMLEELSITDKKKEVN